MRLLIITQKVDKNDAILGFFHRWIEEFSKHAEQVTVITLYKGEYSFPHNVRVLSLGKEEYISRFQYVTRFYRYIWNERNNYDSVFVHMNQVYVLLGGFVWKFLKKPIGLWYVHKSTPLSLRFAIPLVDYIFSVSKDSFVIQTKKLHAVGHGIDTALYVEKKETSDTHDAVILSVGRIAKVKNVDLCIMALKDLIDRGISAKLVIAGEAIYEGDTKYLSLLHVLASELGIKDHVEFIGKVVPHDTPALYRSADIFINLSDTGGVDKVVLEAMASGTKILTSNTTFALILDERYKTSKNREEIAQKLIALLGAPIDHQLAQYVQENHAISALIPKILSVYLKKRE